MKCISFIFCLEVFTCCFWATSCATLQLPRYQPKDILTALDKASIVDIEGKLPEDDVGSLTKKLTNLPYRIRNQKDITAIHRFLEAADLRYDNQTSSDLKKGQRFTTDLGVRITIDHQFHFGIVCDDLIIFDNYDTYCEHTFDGREDTDFLREFALLLGRIQKKYE